MALLLSSSAYAGDLNVNCFLNEDEGSYLQLSDPFMGKNNISLHFDYGNYSYYVFVTRKSLFEDYDYEVIKVSKQDMSFQKILLRAKNYNDMVKVDEHVYCITND